MLVVLVTAVLATVGCGEDSASVFAGAWRGTATATPVKVVTGSDRPPYTPVSWSALAIAVDADPDTLLLTEFCPQQHDLAIPLTMGVDRASYVGAPVVCGSVVMPAYQGASGEEWSTCPGALLEIRNFALETRDAGISLYGEGAATITGCGKVWDSVLLQFYADRVRVAGGR